MAMPVTRYAKSGEVHIAYQVFGNGPIDLVLIPGFVSHIENSGMGPISRAGSFVWPASLAW